MISFKSIKIRNFLSVESIDLEFTKGIIFVKGSNLDDSKSTSNGSGKTSIFDSLMWCLYGETSKGKTADSVVNKQLGIDTEVELKFSKLEEEYKITRYRKHSVYGDDLKIVLNNKDISLKGLRQSQELIHKVLGIPRNLFDSTIFITQGFTSRFSLLTETERRLLFERIRNVEVWDKARTISKEKADKLDKEIIQKNTEITTYLNKIIPNLENDLNKNLETIQDYSIKLLDLKPDYSQVENLNSNLRTELEKQQTIATKQQLIRNQLDLNRKLLLDLEPEKKTQSLLFNSTNSQFQQIQSELKYIPTGECKICGKNTQDFYKDKISELSVKLDEIKVKKLELEQVLKEKEDSYQTTNNLVQSLYQKNSGIENILNQSLLLSQQIKTKLQEIDSEYEKNKQLILQKLDITNKSNVEIEEKINSLKLLSNELQESSKILETNSLVYKELDKVFSPKGIRSYLIAQDLETVNSSLQDYSEYLFSNAKARLIFKGESIESSKISIELEDSMNNTFDYSDCSGGQSRRIDILIQFAIRDLIFNISNLNANVLILDEIFDSLDREGILNVLELVTTNYKDYCVYVISQIPDLPYEYFDNTLNLVKSNGITKLSY